MENAISIKIPVFSGKSQLRRRSGRNETVMLRWLGQDFTLTYHINRSNPDWSFLDTWYTYEIKDLYRMNQGSPLAESLFSYMCSRIED